MCTMIILRTTYKMVFSLDDLQKESWPVLHGFSEDLKEVALVVKINQDSQFLKRKKRFTGGKTSEKTGTFTLSSHVLTCKTLRSSSTLIFAVLSFCRRSS